MPELIEIPLSCGATLYCRPVPPFATSAVHARLPPPPMPKVEVTSAAGGAEMHTALPGSEEYENYTIRQREYRRQIGVMMEMFSVNYSVVYWTWPTAPGEECREPPEDWELPEIMQEYEVSTGEGPDRRAQYLLYELILQESDRAQLEEVMYPTETVTKEDILAALVPFGSSDTVNLSVILRLARRA